MQLELKKNIDGTGFAIFIIGVSKKIMVPLSQEISELLGRMLAEEGIKGHSLLVPAHLMNGFKKQ